MRFLAVVISMIALAFGQIESWLLRLAHTIDPSLKQDVEESMSEDVVDPLLKDEWR